MPVKSWTLVNSANGNIMDRLKISPQDLGLAEGDWRANCRVLEGGLSDGVQVVTLHSGRLAVNVLPTRGMGIHKAWLDGEEFGWKSPVRGPVHPKFVDVGEPSGLGWLDGFDELLCRCGLVSNGAPEFDAKTNRLAYPVHGRIANRPAHQVELSVDTDKGVLTLRGVVEETRFHFTKLRMTTTVTLPLGGSTCHIHDEVENFSAGPAEMQMLYHVNFGLPLLDAGSQVVVPAKTVVPRNERAASGIKTWDSYAAPEPNWEEMVYFLDLHGDDAGRTRTLLKNAHGTRGASLVYNTKELPHFSLWKNTTAEADGYVTGLEPGTNYPNPRSYEGKQGRVVKLGPAEKYSMSVGLEFHATAAEVDAAEEDVNKLRDGCEPKVFDKPQEGWCSP